MLPIVLYAPYLCYKSNRIKTDMLTFRTLDSLNINDTLDDKWKLLPVTRYAKSKEGSLFFNDNNNKEFIGTFYYIEPESKTKLAYRTHLEYKNKYHAYIDLINKSNINFDIKDISNYLNDNTFSFKVLRGEITLKHDLMYTPLEIWNLLKENDIDFPTFVLDDNYMIYDDFKNLFPENIGEAKIISDEYKFFDINRENYENEPDFEDYLEDYGNIDLANEKYRQNIIDNKYYNAKGFVFYPKDIITEDFVKSLPQIPRYIGNWIGSPGKSDIFDQILTMIGVELNIDIIIFNGIIGSHSIVQEILDCRKRDESFKSLIYED